MSTSVIETNEDVSKDISKEENNLFEHESHAIYARVTGTKELESIASKNIAIIKKNDSIKSRVTQIINHINTQPEPILIVGKSNAISKMLTVSEILKCKIREQLPELKIIQYNKLTKQSSLTNPNYKHTKNTAKQRNNIDAFMNDTSIHGHKIYQLPILYILFTRGNHSLDTSGWTSQDT